MTEAVMSKEVQSGRSILKDIITALETLNNCGCNRKIFPHKCKHSHSDNFYTEEE